MLNDETTVDEDAWFETEEPTDEEQAEEEQIQARVSCWLSNCIASNSSESEVQTEWQLRIAAQMHWQSNPRKPRSDSNSEFKRPRKSSEELTKNSLSSRKSFECQRN